MDVVITEVKEKICGKCNVNIREKHNTMCEQCSLAYDKKITRNYIITLIVSVVLITLIIEFRFDIVNLFGIAKQYFLQLPSFVKTFLLTVVLVPVPLLIIYIAILGFIDELKG